MCFQGFVYFACGHNRVFTDNCHLALDHPFYMQLNCENYHHSSAHPDRPCGAGGYYCAREDKDGAFLDHVHATYDAAQKSLADIDVQLGRLKTVADDFTLRANALNLSREARMREVDYGRIQNAFLALRQKRQTSQQACIQAMSIIQSAMQWYSQKKQHLQSGSSSTLPALVPSSTFPNKVPAELRRPRPARNGMDVPTGLPTASRPLSAVSAGGVKQQLLANWQQSPEEACTTDDKRRDHQTQLQSRHLQPPPALQRDGSRSKMGSAKGQVSAGTPKPHSRRSGSGVDNDNSTWRISGNVRRSARVRDKKISYAEDTGSSVASREPSPDKSDVSGFSPSKSEANNSERSDSPAKSSQHLPRQVAAKRTSSGILKPPPESTSLSDKISEWKKRSLNATASPLRGRKTLVLKDVLNSTPEKPTARSTPVTNGTQLSHPSTTPHAGLANPSALMGPPSSSLPALLAAQSLQAATTNSYHQVLQHNAALSLSPPQYGMQRSITSVPPMPLGTQQQWAMQRSSSNSAVLDRWNAPSAIPYGTPRSTGMLPPSSVDRRDSHFEDAPRNFDAFPSRPDYERMQRSFSSAAYLTPDARPYPMLGYAEPNKRSALPSSPMMAPPDKRMRLSLPDQLASPGVYRGSSPPSEQTAHVSPPPQAPHHPMLHSIAALPLASAPPSLSAMIAPDRAKRIPSDDANQGSAEDEDTVHATSSDPQQEAIPHEKDDAEAGAGSAAEHLDIDWSVVNDDVM